MKTLLILGAGGHGRSVAEAALPQGEWESVIFLDDAWPQVEELLGCKVMGKVADIGKGVIINANATVDHDVQMGDLSHIGVGVQLAGGVKIGARAWLQAGSCCGYHVQVAGGERVSPGTALY